MDVREKLVELLGGLFCGDYGVNGCDSCEYNTEAQCNAYAFADHLIAYGVTVQEWISVKDRLPPYNHDVLVYRPNMATKILVDFYDGYYGEDDDEWYEGWVKYGKDIHNNPIITHWAYLPQQPKGE